MTMNRPFHDTKPAMRLGELNQRLPHACGRLEPVVHKQF
jgi:hypothetical protein